MYFNWILNKTIQLSKYIKKDNRLFYNKIDRLNHKINSKKSMLFYNKKI